MTRVVIFLLLLASVVAADTAKNYRVLKSAHIFAIGGIRREGAITEEESAFNALCRERDAAQRFRRLLHEASIEGQMYALLGLRQLHAPDYKAQVERYRRSTRMVNTGAGCEIGPDKVSYIVNEWWTRCPSNRPNQSVELTATRCTFTF
jgi:hypothetical protein